MQFRDNNFTFVASDVSTYLSCKHAIQLHKQYRVEGKAIPQPTDDVLQVLIKRGEEHEAQYVEYLRKQNLRCTHSQKKSVDETMNAMAKGIDVIVQGRLEVGEWSGYPDILLKVHGQSKFGDWQYEVQDTKLSVNTRTSSIIQLCFYTELLAAVQDVASKQFSVVMPGDTKKPFIIDPYDFNDFKWYYELVKDNFRAAISVEPNTYPERIEHCNICNWWAICNQRRREDDHLSFVAGMRNSQIEELKLQNITTLKGFATAERIDRPNRGNYENLLKRKAQARIQYEAKISDSLLHRAILPIEDKRGFNRLPLASPGDIYLDLEGDAFYPGGSFEYLFGVIFRENDILRYKGEWATTRAEEKQSFIKTMQFILQRLKKFPDLFIYHYGHYEPTTFKRLAHTYASYEPELDDLLRNGKFVDLHHIVKEALIASVERYSLKDIERFAKYTRTTDLREAGLARRQIESSLQLNEFSSLPKGPIEKVRSYNEDDCLATDRLHVWLESERNKLAATGVSILRPIFTSEPPNQKLLDLERDSKTKFEHLTKDLPADRDIWTDEHNAKWLLANQLQYFRRENKSAWWEHFRLQKAEYDDLIQDKSAIAGMKFEKALDDKVHQYSFVEQETTLKPGDNVFIANSYNKENPFGVDLGKIIDINLEKHTVDIKKTKNAHEIHPNAIHEFDIINIEKLWAAILNIASTILDEFGDGLGRSGPFTSAKDLLMRRVPHLKGNRKGAFTEERDKELTDTATRLALELDRSILPIQGPPGTGKTYTGAHIIIRLIKEGKKVGVTAVSHRVITTLFESTHKEAAKLGVKLKFVHKVKKKDPEMPDWIIQTTDEKKVLNQIKELSVVGGTAWLWADDDFVRSVDYLIIDEAGQMSLSQALAASRAADNIILLGDPQQLEQPQRGAHPEGSGVAALSHLLNGEKVMPAGQGLFLNETRRINPAIAEFTSNAFYNGQLGYLEKLVNQKISGGTLFDGEGLFFVPVVHTGNQDRSNEEILAIHKIVVNLLGCGSWTNAERVTARLKADDILIVAPYNAQVDALKELLKDTGVSVGTVDKFQGREAPVVIYSLTASSAEDAPHGIGFLFNPNRLNVATSRAKCICVMVGSPTLFEAECKTIEQMKWVNALCYYRKLSKEIVM